MDLRLHPIYYIHWQTYHQLFGANEGMGGAGKRDLLAHVSARKGSLNLDNNTEKSERNHLKHFVFLIHCNN